MDAGAKAAAYDGVKEIQSIVDRANAARNAGHEPMPEDKYNRDAND